MENNKLIAEFMGGQKVLPNHYVYNMPTHNNLCYEIKELKYHASWDWLIPVVQKLIDVYISIDEQDEQDLQQSILFDKVGDVYEIVVELIKKYNNER